MHGPDVERCAPHPRIQSGPNLLASPYVYPKATSVGLLFHMYVAVIAKLSETNIVVNRVQRTIKRQFANLLVTAHISDLANII